MCPILSLLCDGELLRASIVATDIIGRPTSNNTIEYAAFYKFKIICYIEDIW